MFTPYSLAVAISAAVSLPKHDPPQPMPAAEIACRCERRGQCPAHLGDVRANVFGEAADFVDEADLQREKSIRGVLDQFGRGEVGGNQRDRAQALRPGNVRRSLESLFQHRPVQCIEHFCCVFLIGADDHRSA